MNKMAFREFNKSHRKFAYAVNNELTNLAKQDKNKSDRIRFLERMFVMAGDKATKVAEKIRDGFLNKKDITVDFLEEETERINAYLDALTKLQLEYLSAASSVSPDYLKFLNYTTATLDNLELEMAFRKVYGARKK